MKPWIIAIRPKTLTASVSPILIAFALALAEGFFNPWLLLTILMTTLSIQIATNLTNDYFDFLKGVDSKKHVGSTKVLVTGAMNLKTLRKGIFLFFSTAALGSLFLILRGGLPIAIIAISSLLFAFFYTAGPASLSKTGLADPIEWIYFGPVAVGGTFYLLTQMCPLYVMIAGAIPGFLSMALLAIDNLRDIEKDSQAGKKTLCVRFGAKFGQNQYRLCLLGGLLTPLILVLLTHSHHYSLLSWLALPLYFQPLKAVAENGAKQTLNQALAQSGLNLLIVCLVFSGGWLL